MGKGQHPNSRANLKPIKPGQVLNPKGRPKRPSFEALLQGQLDARITVKEGNTLSETTLREHIAFKFLEALADGEPWAFKEFLGREWLQKTIVEHIVSGDDTERLGDAITRLLAGSDSADEGAEDDSDGEPVRH